MLESTAPLFHSAKRRSSAARMSFLFTSPDTTRIIFSGSQYFLWKSTRSSRLMASRSRAVACRVEKWSSPKINQSNSRRRIFPASTADATGDQILLRGVNAAPISVQRDGAAAGGTYDALGQFVQIEIYHIGRSAPPCL